MNVATLRKLLTLAPHINAALAWSVSAAPRLIVAGCLTTGAGAAATVYDVVTTYTSVNGAGPAATVAGAGMVVAARLWHRFQLTVNEDKQ